MPPGDSRRCRGKKPADAQQAQQGNSQPITMSGTVSDSGVNQQSGQIARQPYSRNNPPHSISNTCRSTTRKPCPCYSTTSKPRRRTPNSPLITCTITEDSIIRQDRCRILEHSLQTQGNSNCPLKPLLGQLQALNKATMSWKRSSSNGRKNFGNSLRKQLAFTRNYISQRSASDVCMQLERPTLATRIRIERIAPKTSNHPVVPSNAASKQSF